MKKEKFKLIDLFCGAGGFTEGFKQVGFNPIFANDQSLDAVITYTYNHPEAIVSDANIQELNPHAVRKKLKLKRGEIDTLVGGPPCQGFSMAGKRNKTDPRNKLYEDFLAFVEVFEPKTLVMENVVGLLTMRTSSDESVIEIISRDFERIGYKTKYEVLDAAEYGAPQHRRRVIFIANSLGVNNGTLFPKITHGPKSHKKTAFSTVGEAIGDLVEVNDSLDAWNHKPMIHSQIVRERLEKMPLGADLAVNQTFLPKRLRRTAFAYNCKRLEWSKPSVTLVPGHYALPVHPTKPRTITVREAARIQGFPDDYLFFGKRDTQAALVGNAVPVELARAIGQRIKVFIG